MKTELEKFIDAHRGALNSRIPNPEVLNRILKHMEANHVVEKPRGTITTLSFFRYAAAVLILAVSALLFIKYRPEANLIRRDYKVGNPKKNMLTDTSERLSKIKVNKPTSTTKFVNNTKTEPAKKSVRYARRGTPVTIISEKEVLLADLKDMDSPTRRIAALAGAKNLQVTDHVGIRAVLETLNGDENTNVRLAALNVLVRLYEEQNIRNELLNSLKTQEDPTIQIALIELFTRKRESSASGALNDIVASDSTLSVVKDYAYAGLFKFRKGQQVRQVYQ